MAPQILHTLLHRLKQTEAVTTTDTSNGQLLQRYLKDRDENAFEILVWRHGAMIWNLCGRMLADRQHQEDAFQATFLTFGAKGNSIRQRQSVGNWLYKVAYRIARALQQKRFDSQEEAPEPTGSDDPLDEVTRREILKGLDEAIASLPDKFRSVVILCYLNGHTTTEAAALLDCPKRTVLSRLATAKNKLQQHLKREGITLTTTSIGALLASEFTVAQMPGNIVRATCHSQAWLGKSGSHSGGPVSARSLSLMKGELRTMWMSKTKWTVACLCAALLLILGLGFGFLGSNNAGAQQATEQAKPGKDRSSTTTKAQRSDTDATETKTPAHRPMGTWKRNLGEFDLVLDIQEKRIVANCVVSGKGHQITLEGEYSVTNDQVLYGVITDVNLDLKASSRGSPEEFMKIEHEFSKLIDQPFSLVYRLNDRRLLIRDAKFGLMGLSKNITNSADELRVFAVGRYANEPKTVRR
ncbi:MAG: RNA polymerase sigma factor [Gemmataceae bacterium]